MVYPIALTLAAALLAAPSAPPPQAAKALPGTVVHMHDFKFVPSTLTVAVGTRVTIINDDDEAHTASALDKSFDSAGLDSHESWTHVFARAGSFPYVCELHPYMKGLIVVRPRSTSKGKS